MNETFEQLQFDVSPTTAIVEAFQIFKDTHSNLLHPTENALLTAVVEGGVWLQVAVHGGMIQTAEVKYHDTAYTTREPLNVTDFYDLRTYQGRISGKGEVAVGRRQKLYSYDADITKGQGSFLVSCIKDMRVLSIGSLPLTHDSTPEGLPVRQSRFGRLRAAGRAMLGCLMNSDITNSGAAAFYYQNFPRA